VGFVCRGSSLARAAAGRGGAGELGVVGGAVGGE
tara:strand:+ start:12376 stop:12477 length:102 start_codon:yes stop_codon:yes gene_type:complete